jgi:FtsP/CotA-like multicopper oxidase with cupredoxin domain
MDETPATTPRSDRLTRRTLLTGLVGTAAVAVAAPRAFAADGGAAPAGQITAVAPNAGTVRRAGAGGEERQVTLYAVKKGTDSANKPIYAWGTSPETASIPGPTIEAVEGDTVRVKVINQTGVEMSLHVHGVDYTIEDDGTRANNGTVPVDGERTYVWRTHKPGPREDGSWRAGSAGYFHYHDFAIGGEFGSAGIAAGLYGAVVVRREGDILPDRQNICVYNEVTINNVTLPNEVDFLANLGDRVEWVVIAHGNQFHTFHLHAHRWANTRTGYLFDGDDTSRVLDNYTVGPGDSFGFQVIAGEGVGPGYWMHHCHVQFHADAGMAGFWIINNADGTPPPGGGGHHGTMAAAKAAPLTNVETALENHEHAGH